LETDESTGTQTVPDGGSAHVELPSGVAVDIGAGSTIDAKGVTTVARDGTAHVEIPGGVAAEVGGGTTIAPDGNITIPANGTAQIALPAGADIAVSGAAGIAPTGGVTLAYGTKAQITPSGGGQAISVGGGYEIIPDFDVPEGFALLWHNPFIDVSEDDWFFGDVKSVYSAALFAGTSANTFSPATPMTRAMLVTVLWRLSGQPAPTEAHKFEDVPAGEWYTDAVSWAAENDIVSVHSETVFGPNDDVTREQIALILFRHAAAGGVDVTGRADVSGFADASRISSWAEDAISWAVYEGLIRGRDNNLLASADKRDARGTRRHHEPLQREIRLIHFCCYPTSLFFLGRAARRQHRAALPPSLCLFRPSGGHNRNSAFLALVAAKARFSQKYDFIW
jgi:hypothetical protein